MKKLLVVLLLSSASVMAADMTMPVLGVADGDTVKSRLDLPCPLCFVSVRIRGIDTPETSFLAKCPDEKRKGVEAKAFMKSLLEGKSSMLVRNVKWDKYGGRIDGNIEVDGKDVGQAMIDKGLAKKYYGTGPKPNWCS